jgi:hypothetical protein
MPVKAQSNPDNRRTEPRQPARGRVELRPDGFATGVPGEMVDINGGGFRARHSFQALVSGHIVEFEYGNLAGRARVVWTRIMSGSVESGFLILPRAEG